MVKKISRRSVLGGTLAASAAMSGVCPAFAVLAPGDLQPRPTSIARCFGWELIKHELDFTFALIEGGHQVLPRFLMQGTGSHAEPVYVYFDLPISGERRRRRLSGMRKYLALTGAECFIQSEATSEAVISRFVTRTSMSVCRHLIVREPHGVQRGTVLHAIRLLTPEEFPADIEALLPLDPVRLTVSDAAEIDDFVESGAVWIMAAAELPAI